MYTALHYTAALPVDNIDMAMHLCLIVYVSSMKDFEVQQQKHPLTDYFQPHTGVACEYVSECIMSE